MLRHMGKAIKATYTRDVLSLRRTFTRVFKYSKSLSSLLADSNNEKLHADVFVFFSLEKSDDDLKTGSS